MVGKREVHFSLRTTDYAEACQIARLERLKLDAEWKRLRRKAKPQQIAELPDGEIWLLATSWLVEQEKLYQDLRLDEEGIENAQTDLAMVAEYEVAASSVFTAVKQLLEREGIELSPQSASWGKLTRRVHAAMVEAETRLLKRHHAANEGLSLNPDFQGVTATTEVRPVAKSTLGGLIEAYEADRTRQPVSPKTRLKELARFRMFREFFGANTLLSDIDRPRVREFIDLLATLPDNAGKRLPGLSLVQAAAEARERQLRPMAIDTANNYLRAFSSLLRYAVEEQLIASNPAQGLQLKGPAVRARDKRLPFSVDDLNSIFSAPLYAGCKDDGRGYAVPGPNRPRRGRFWVPLVALFSGMRLNEIGQLTLDDIAEEDGVIVILVRGADDDETKRIKTAAGERFVPIHPELRRIGFLDYVEAQREVSSVNARLFPDVSIARTGYASDNFSKWFARFLDKLGIQDDRKVFHSFRHNYRDALREADISIEKVRALGGWSSGRTEDDYGRGLRASTLARDIEAVRYPGLILDHLVLGPLRNGGAD